MTRTWIAVATVGLILTEVVVAQVSPSGPATWGGPPGGISRPTTSPYLNLMGRGNPAINYFGIVRPQQQFQTFLSGSTGAPGIGAPEDLTDPELRRGTGHPATFDNLSHYYFNNPAVPTQRGLGGMGGRMGGSMGMPAGQPGGLGGSMMGRGIATPGMPPLGAGRVTGRIR